MLSPEQKALIEDFTQESKEILDGLEDIIADLETGRGKAEGFATIALKIDGIMGCAKTLGLEGLPELSLALKVISNLAEGCKMLGYKAAQVKEGEVVKIVAGFLADAVEMVENAIDDLNKGYISFDAEDAARIKDRIVWISGKLSLSAEDQAKILARFGLK